MTGNSSLVAARSMSRVIRTLMFKLSGQGRGRLLTATPSFANASGIILQERYLLLLQATLAHLSFHPAFKKSLAHLLNARACLPQLLDRLGPGFFGAGERGATAQVNATGAKSAVAVDDELAER